MPQLTVGQRVGKGPGEVDQVPLLIVLWAPGCSPGASGSRGQGGLSGLSLTSISSPGGTERTKGPSSIQFPGGAWA